MTELHGRDRRKANPLGPTIGGSKRRAPSASASEGLAFLLYEAIQIVVGLPTDTDLR